jgi:hypothetical protein
VVDAPCVKGLEKLTCVRLAEVISQKNVVAAEIITDALYAQDKHGDPFVQSLVGGGHVTEWDLAKLVAENFQLPFLMASSYAISDEAKKRLPEKILFEHMLVPLDVFDDVVCVVMPILTPYDVLGKIQRDLRVEVFPYVGLISENKKVLSDMFATFKQWFEQDQKRREQLATKRASTKGQQQKGDWMSIFDAGDQAIHDGLGGPPQPQPQQQKKPGPRRP